MIGWFAAVAFGGALGPAVTVRHVAAPEVVVPGVQRIEVGPFEGLGAEALRAEFLAALTDEPTRLADPVKEAQQAIVRVGELAGETGARAVGRGLQGRMAKRAANGAAVRLATTLKVAPLEFDDGLSVERFHFVEHPAEAVFQVSVVVEDHIEHYRRRVPRLDPAGQPVEDAAGRVVTYEVPCRRREVTAWVEWTLTGSSLKRSGSFARRNGASACAHQDKVLTDASTLALEALPGAGRELARKISPYWRTQRLPLVADDDAPEAMYAVLNGHWSEALCSLAEGAKARPDSLEAQLNYGILLEGWGHHEHAAVQYDRASSLSSRGVVNRADRRNTKRMQEIARMTEAWAWTYAPGQPAPCTPPE